MSNIVEIPPRSGTAFEIEAGQVLTVIDPHMKWELRTQLKSLHREFGHIMIYVTHDQTEALTFADKVVVMYDGRVVQIGTPEELFERPNHTFVGYFIGSPGMNVLPVRIDGQGAHIGSHAISLDGQLPGNGDARMELGVRPEYVRIGEKGIPAQILRVEDTGRRKIVHATLEGQPIAAIVAEGTALPSEPRISFDPAGINLYADSWRVDPGSARQGGAT